MSLPSEPTYSEVIDRLIRENRPAEWLLYALCTVLVFTAVFMYVYGGVTSQPWLAASGGIPTALTSLPIHRIANNRRENMMIRLMTIPLGNAKTAEEAARVVYQVFLAIHGIKIPELDQQVTADAENS